MKGRRSLSQNVFGENIRLFEDAFDVSIGYERSNNPFSSPGKNIKCN